MNMVIRNGVLHLGGGENSAQKVGDPAEVHTLFTPFKYLTNRYFCATHYTF